MHVYSDPLYKSELHSINCRGLQSHKNTQKLHTAALNDALQNKVFLKLTKKTKKTFKQPEGNYKIM